MIISYRKNAIVVGVLFLMGFLGVPSMSLLKPVLGAPDVLASIAVNETGFLAGVLLLALMAFACAGIAIALYPVLKKYSPGLAIGSVSFRSLESALFLVGALCLFTLVPISREYVAASGLAAFSTNAAVTALISINDFSQNVLGLMAWDIGALMYYTVFFRTKLVPRWLSVWGIAGVILSLVSVFLTAFGAMQLSSDAQTFLNIPIGLQELALAVWLIAKGYNKSVLPAETL